MRATTKEPPNGGKRARCGLALKFGNVEECQGGDPA